MRLSLKNSITRQFAKGLCLTLLSGSVLSGQAVAAEWKNPTIKPDVRVDFRYRDTDDSSDKNDDKKTKHFYQTRMRLDIRGKINNDTKYRVRFRFNRGADRNKFDNTSNISDYYYVDRQIIKNLWLRVGRQRAEMFTYEASYKNSDMYHYSQTFFKSGSSRRLVGAALSYKLSNNKIGFQVLNGTVPTATKSSSNNQQVENNLMSLFWKGQFLDGMLKPRASLVVDTTAKQKDKATGEVITDEYTSQAIGLGAQIFVNKLKFDVEYNSYVTDQYKTKTNNVVATTKKEEWLGLILGVRYGKKGDFIHGVLKYTQDEKKQGSKTDYNRLSLAAEFYPENGGVRYHVAYISGETKAQGSKSVKDSELNLGLKLLL